jgi:hypothetical protein
MSTTSTTTPSIVSHAGLDRLLNTGASITKSLKTLSNVKDAANIIALVGVMTLVTVASRKLENGETSFAVEWTALFGVAVLSFWLLSRLLEPALTIVKSGFKTYAAYLREKSNEDAFFEAARKDSRLMREIMAAKTRAER